MSTGSFAWLKQQRSKADLFFFLLGPVVNNPLTHRAFPTTSVYPFECLTDLQVVSLQSSARPPFSSGSIFVSAATLKMSMFAKIANHVCHKVDMFHSLAGSAQHEKKDASKNIPYSYHPLHTYLYMTYCL